MDNDIVTSILQYNNIPRYNPIYHNTLYTYHVLMDKRVQWPQPLYSVTYGTVNKQLSTCVRFLLLFLKYSFSSPREYREQNTEFRRRFDKCDDDTCRTLVTRLIILRRTRFMSLLHTVPLVFILS